MKRSMNSRVLTLLASLVTALLMLSAAGADGEPNVDVVSLDSSAFPQVTAVVNVVDGGGRPVTGLSPAEFAPTVEGQPATVISLQSAVDAQVSLSVVLAIDVSGSMAGEPLTQAKKAATDFALALSPQDTVAVLTFSDGVTLVQDFTADKNAAAATIAGLQAVGNTALHEATARAAQKALESPLPRRVVVLLSDGQDYGGLSSISGPDSVEQVRAAGTPMYAIGLGADIDRNYLTQLAQATNARLLETPDAAGLSQLYAEIGELLRSQYVVEFTSPVVDRTRDVTVQLTVNISGAAVIATEVMPAVGGGVPAPIVSLPGLPTGQEIADALTLDASVEGESIQSVSFIVDGEKVAEDEEAPFQMVLDPASFQTGNHTVRVEARNAIGGVGFTEVAFVVPAAVVNGGGGAAGLPTALLGVMALALLAVAVAYLLLRRRLRRLPREAVEVRLRPWSNAVAAGNGSQEHAVEDTEPVGIPQVPVDEPQGRLVIVSGPGEGRTFDLGTRPVSIGSAGWCDVVIPDDGQVGAEEARAWVHQSKRLIFHRLTRLSVIASEGASGGWIVLQDGEEIGVGRCRLLFQLQLPASSEEKAVSRAIDDALRGLSRSDSAVADLATFPAAPAPDAPADEESPSDADSVAC